MKITDEAVSRLPISHGRADLLEEILMSDPVDRTVVPIRAHRLRPVVAVVGAAAAVAALAVGVPVALQGGGGKVASAGSTVPSAAASLTPSAVPSVATPAPDPTPSIRTVQIDQTPEQAARSPFAILRAPGFRVLNTDAGKSEGGSITYGLGDPVDEVYPGGSSHRGATFMVSLNAYPAASYGDRVATWSKDGGSFEQVTVVGKPAKLVVNDDTVTVLREAVGSWFLEIQIMGVTKAQALLLLGQLEGTDAKGLAASLPDTYIQPGERKAAIAKMAADVPLPPGFSLTQVTTTQTDPHQVGVAVTTAIGCAWLDQFEAGRRQEAIDALATSRSWKVLNDMNATGGWSEAFWGISAALAGKGGGEWAGESPAKRLAGLRTEIGCR